MTSTLRQRLPIDIVVSAPTAHSDTSSDSGNDSGDESHLKPFAPVRTINHTLVVVICPTLHRNSHLTRVLDFFSPAPAVFLLAIVAISFLVAYVHRQGSPRCYPSPLLRAIGAKVFQLHRRGLFDDWCRNLLGIFHRLFLRNQRFSRQRSCWSRSQVGCLVCLLDCRRMELHWNLDYWCVYTRCLDTSASLMSGSFVVYALLLFHLLSSRM